MLGSTMFFPHHTIARRILVNATLIWLGLRFVALVVGWGFSTSPLLAGWIVLLTTGLAVFDVRRRSRHLLLENLGVSWLPVGVLAAFPPVSFELIWLLVSRT